MAHVIVKLPRRHDVVDDSIGFGDETLPRDVRVPPAVAGNLHESPVDRRLSSHPGAMVFSALLKHLEPDRRQRAEIPERSDEQSRARSPNLLI
jgi:hypothetical protein